MVDITGLTVPLPPTTVPFISWDICWGVPVIVVWFVVRTIVLPFTKSTVWVEGLTVTTGLPLDEKPLEEKPLDENPPEPKLLTGIGETEFTGIAATELFRLFSIAEVALTGPIVVVVVVVVELNTPVEPAVDVAEGTVVEPTTLGLTTVGETTLALGVVMIGIIVGMLADGDGLNEVVFVALVLVELKTAVPGLLGVEKMKLLLGLDIVCPGTNVCQVVVLVVVFGLVTSGVITGFVTTGVITVGVDTVFVFVTKFGFVVEEVVFEEIIVVPVPVPVAVLSMGKPVLVFVIVCL